MAAWADVVVAAPAFAAAVQDAFDAFLHKTLATLRADGSPRLSGTEARFRDGELWLGMMPGSRKMADVRRDPRVAIHSATADPDLKRGDARISGRLVEAADAGSHQRYSGDATAAAPEFGLFRVDISEVVLTRLGGDPPDHLVIEFWTPEGGLRQLERR